MQESIFFLRYNYYEICEIGEVFDVLYEMVLVELAPSDAMIQSRFEQTTSSREILYFGSFDDSLNWANYQETTSRLAYPNYRAKLPQDFVRESWGPSHEQVFKVLRIMQLDPKELLHFRDDFTCKAERVEFLNAKSHWWNRNIASVRTAISFTLSRRNQHPPLRSDVEGGILDYHDEDQEWKREMGISGDDALLYDHFVEDDEE